MGRLFLINFDDRRVPAIPCSYYSCLQCGTHITTSQDKILLDLYKKIVNVCVDDPTYYRMSPRIMGVRIADVHCLKCNAKLGYKNVKITEETKELQGTCILHRYLLSSRNVNGGPHANNEQQLVEIAL